MLHADRQRALIFGSLAEAYDRARPSYPTALIDDLMSERPKSVLDVGCGTGKAARLLIERGCEVLGVEPDERMAAIAAGHGVNVEVTTFEDWDPSARTFDLLTSAQAWHWVDPLIGAQKSASVLRPGGRLALFWNHLHHEPQVLAALAPVYERVAPAIAANTMALGVLPDSERGRDTAALGATGRFGDIEARAYAWQRSFTRAEWLDYLRTCSDHAMLPEATLEALLDAVGAAIDGLGGAIAVPYSTILITARAHTDTLR